MGLNGSKQAPLEVFERTAVEEVKRHEAEQGMPEAEVVEVVRESGERVRFE